MNITCLENFFPFNRCSISERPFSSGRSPFVSCFCLTKSEMFSETSAALLGPTKSVVLDISCYKKLLPEVAKKNTIVLLTNEINSNNLNGLCKSKNNIN